MTRLNGRAVLIAVTASRLFGQPQIQSLSFEVASVKPAPRTTDRTWFMSLEDQEHPIQASSPP